MQKYDAAKITRPITQEKINNVNHRFRDAVIKNSNLSVLDNDYGKYNNFENKKFRDNAIAHANIEQEILNNASKIEFNNSLIGDDFFKEQSNVEKTIKEIYENKELNRNYLAGKLNSEDEKKIEKEQLVSEASKLKKNKTLNIPRSNSNASQILDIKNEPQKSSEKNISQSAPEPQNGYVPMGVII
jgi:nitrous oxide reductase